MEEYVQVITTTNRLEEGEKIATSLVEKRLAACAQLIGPIESTYWWKGKIEKDQEWLCLLKTRKSLLAEIEKAIKAIHTYETPEIVAVPIIAGSKEYMKWLGREIRNE